MSFCHINTIIAWQHLVAGTQGRFSVSTAFSVMALSLAALWVGLDPEVNLCAQHHQSSITHWFTGAPNSLQTQFITGFADVMLTLLSRVSSF